jgi:hypothetical protein
MGYRQVSYRIQDHPQIELFSELDFRYYQESETRFECVLLDSMLKRAPLCVRTPRTYYTKTEKLLKIKN